MKLTTRVAALTLICAAMIGGVQICRYLIDVPSPRVPPAAVRADAVGMLEDTSGASGSSPEREVHFFSHSISLSGRMERLAAEDPAEAAREAMALPSEEEKAEALAAVIQVWVQLAPGEALAFVRQLDDPELRSTALGRAGRTLATKEPAVAMDLAEGFSPGSDRDNYMDVVVHAWATQQPRDAADWALQLPEGEHRARVQSSIAIEWAQTDPAKAADFVAVEFSTGRRQEEAALMVAFRWANVEPQAAADWVQKFPESDLRAQMLRGVIGYWSAKNAAAASRWIAGLPDGNFRKTAEGAISAPSQGAFP